MKNKITIKEFTNWLFMAEKEYEEKFEEKHKKGLNITRIVGLILIICCIPLLRLLLTGVVNPIFWKFSSIVRLLISAFFLFILIAVYKAWIKSFWDFLKKDSIVHYIFMALIPAAIIFFGYQYIVVKSSVKDTHKGKDIVQTDTLKNDYDEIIDRLNGFYSTLFAAITVIAAILAFGAWRTIKELRDNLESFKKIEGDIKFLKEKSELAKWVQTLFDKDEEKKIMNSSSLDLSEEDKKKLERVKNKILEDTTDDSWLKVVYAKELMKKNQIEENYIKVQKIYDYIENRDLLRKESDLIGILFHMKGQLYWEWYRFKKNSFKEKIEKNVGVKWSDWWFTNNVENSQLIKNSVSYYEKALDDLSIKEEPRDETLGNISVTLIELSKFQSEESEKNKYLEKALEYLNQRKKDYNTYWDRARALYYIDAKKKKEGYEKLLIKVAEEIESKKVKKFFIDTMEDEINEIELSGKKGFPGDERLIKKLKEYLDNKYLS